MSNIIAIIGGGAAGVITLSELVVKLVNEKRTDVKIYIFEKNDELGPGLAYSSNADSHIVNLKAGLMNAAPNRLSQRKNNDTYAKATIATNYLQDKNFLNWIEKNYSKIKQAYPDSTLDSDSYPPRRIFGMYLAALADEAICLAKTNNIEVYVKCNFEVLDVVYKNNKEILVCGEKFKLEVNVAILCIGHLASDYYKNLRGFNNYYHSPWLIKNQQYDIFNKESITIIGTRLTAIDTALGLFEKGYKGRITMLSRSGLVPAVIGPTTDYKRKYLTLEQIEDSTIDGSEKLTIENLLDLFWQEIEVAENIKLSESDKDKILNPPKDTEKWLQTQIKQAESGERKWQAVLASLYRYVPHLWKKLSFESQQEFLRDYYSVWMTYLAAMPLETAKKILSLIENQQLEIINGLSNISYNPIKCLFEIKLENNSELETVCLINATGAGHNIENSDITLLDNLLKSGLITPHPIGGINVKFKSLNIINNAEKLIPNIYVVGDMTWGVCMATADLGQINFEVSRVITNLWNTHLKLAKSPDRVSISQVAEIKNSEALSTMGFLKDKTTDISKIITTDNPSQETSVTNFYSLKN